MNTEVNATKERELTITSTQYRIYFSTPLNTFMFWSLIKGSGNLTCTLHATEVKFLRRNKGCAKIEK
jgi:hypothetical protein